MGTHLDLDLHGIFLENLENFTYDDNYESDCSPESHSRFEAVFIPVLYSLTLVVGLLGNGLLLGVLCRRRRSWTVTDTFILHLGVGDSLLLVTLPFWAAQATQDQGWSFGTPFCKITGAIFNINFYSGIFLLVCINLDPYLSSIRAARLFSRQKPWLIRAGCLVVWLSSLLLSIPDWVFLEAAKDGRMECAHKFLLVSQSAFDWRWASRLLCHIVGFLLPSAVLLFCCSCFLLWMQRGSQGLQRQRAFKTILAMTVVFIFCWTPYNITLMMDTLQKKPKVTEEPDPCAVTRTPLETGLLVTSALGCFHACLNPLLYFILCRNFRKSTLEMLQFATGSQVDSKLSLWELGVGEEPSPAPGQEKVVLKQMTSIEEQVQLTHS